jgi:hypothetical protein
MAAVVARVRLEPFVEAAVVKFMIQAQRLAC